jgi:hypothetical protein
MIAGNIACFMTACISGKYFGAQLNSYWCYIGKSTQSVRWYDNRSILWKKECVCYLRKLSTVVQYVAIYWPKLKWITWKSYKIIRAMIAGNIACFMTACISGKYFVPLIISNWKRKMYRMYDYAVADRGWLRLWYVYKCTW